MTAARLIVIVLAALPLAGHAEDDRLYESMHGVVIGRVFMTPQHRDRLDKQRLSPPAAAATAGASEDTVRSTPDPQPRAAGFIIGRAGTTRVWRNGDFVAAETMAPGRIGFPGDIRITRHRPPAGAAVATAGIDENDAEETPRRQPAGDTDSREAGRDAE